jgi:MFS family permease
MAAWCLSGQGLVWALFVPVAIASIGSGLCQPPAMAAGLSIYPRMAGAASGVIGFMQMTASSVGTLAVGLLPQHSVIGTVAVVVACMVLAMVAGLLALRLSRSALPVRAAAPLAVKPGPVAGARKPERRVAVAAYVLDSLRGLLRGARCADASERVRPYHRRAALSAAAGCLSISSSCSAVS